MEVYWRHRLRIYRKLEVIILYHNTSVQNAYPGCIPVSVPLLYWRQTTIQWWLLPHDIDLVLIPSSTLFAELQIEVEQHFGQDETHLVIRHTLKS